jgi:ABC-type Fe3+-hydroxamate transport system substrate-binding protein
MTFNRNTYSNDLLGIFGGENVFADRERLYPLKADLGIGEAVKREGKDIRYPRVTVEEIHQAAPELILLPNEPFAFNQEHKQLLLKELKTTPAVKNNHVQFVDGSLITWHGTRIGKAIQELPKYFE